MYSLIYEWKEIKFVLIEITKTKLQYKISHFLFAQVCSSLFK